jgi:hypothetical protein
MATLDFFAEIDRVTRELYKEENEVKSLGNYSVWVEGIGARTILARREIAVRPDAPRRGTVRSGRPSTGSSAGFHAERNCFLAQAGD